jgi:hypothetical protein
MDIDKMQIQIVHLSAFKKRIEALIPILEEMCKDYEAHKVAYAAAQAEKESGPEPELFDP